MSGSISGRFSKFLCLLLSIVIGFSSALILLEPLDVFAEGTVNVTGATGWGEGGGLQIEVSGFSEGESVEVTINLNSDVTAAFNGDAD